MIFYNIYATEKEEKLIIVFYWTKTLDLIAKFLATYGLKYYRLDGKV